MAGGRWWWWRLRPSAADGGDVAEARVGRHRDTPRPLTKASSLLWPHCSSPLLPISSLPCSPPSFLPADSEAALRRRSLPPRGPAAPAVVRGPRQRSRTTRGASAALRGPSRHPGRPRGRPSLPTVGKGHLLQDAPGSLQRRVIIDWPSRLRLAEGLVSQADIEPERPSEHGGPGTGGVTSRAAVSADTG